MRGKVFCENTEIAEGTTVTISAALNPFLCTLYLNKICLNQIQNWGNIGAAQSIFREGGPRFGI